MNFEKITMTKTFITVIATQGKKEIINEKGEIEIESSLKSTKYESPENERLLIEKPIRFPISALLNGYVEKGDKIRIIAIKLDRPDPDYNYHNFFIP